MPSTLLRKISSISVKLLFGMYDYELDISSEDSSYDEKITIFYGDNGSGKSTILRLAFHMLASNPRSGHKTFLLKTDFQQLIVSFNDGTTVKAFRDKDRISGPYTLSVKRPKKKALSGQVTSSSADEDEDLQVIILPALKDLDCAIYLLSDDRAIHRAGVTVESGSRAYRHKHFNDEILRREREIEYFTYTGELAETPEDMAKQLLRSSIERTEDWFRRRALGGSTRGDSGVNELYAKILKRISDVGGGSKEATSSKKTIQNRINQLVDESKNFAKYGLLPVFDGKDIIQILNTANTKTFDVIVNVLTPYLDSMETKNEAMKNIYDRIDTFVTVAGKFYTNKTLSYNLRKGIKITAPDDRDLDPEMLSSGERHLLLLFCTSIVTGDRPSILMIDEPEISLNIKWQRMLIDALIQCIGDNDIQFIFSTHSLEILSKHKSRVVKLENKRG